MQLSDQVTTISGPSQLPDALNFSVLNSLGLDTIIATGSDHWTDYNAHDPGTTTLEILSLAITDLGYRASFPIEDILTIGQTSNDKPNYYPDQFHTAIDILSSAPVTTQDLQKTIIDIKGISNAWVRPQTHQQTPYRCLFDIIVRPTFQELQNIDLYFNISTRINKTQTASLKKILTELKKIKSGKAGRVNNDLATILASLWGIADSHIADIEDSLNALFSSVPILFQEIYKKLSPLITEEKHLYANDQTIRAGLLDLLKDLFFTEKLPNDHWIPIGLRSALEQIRYAANCYRALYHNVFHTFRKNRALNRDLGNIIIQQEAEVFFKLDLTVSPEANYEKTLANALFTLNGILENRIDFSSLEESLVTAKQNVNEVFNGPNLQHGFLTDSNLTNKLRTLLSSKLTNIIRHLPGVLRVNSLKFYLSEKADKPGNSEWTSKTIIPDYLAPSLAPIDQNSYSTPIDQSILNNAFSDLVHQQRPSKLAPTERDLPIPPGTFRNPESYLSIQEDFPRIYELQPHGPTAKPTRERLGEIRQFQAYLLIFDQLLADFLAQLSNLGKLYSWSPEICKTYFFKSLETTVTDLEDLVDLEYHKNYLPKLRESKSEYLNRRGAFLETLLKRMGRTLNKDLTTLSTDLKLATTTNEKARNILANYPKLSSRRGSGEVFSENLAPLSKQEDIRTLSGLSDWIHALAGYRLLDEKDKLLLGNLQQADLKDLSTAIPWMPQFSITSVSKAPLNFQDIMQVGMDPSNYKLDKNNQLLTKEEKSQWLTYTLTPILLENPKTPSNIPIKGSKNIIVAMHSSTLYFRVFDNQSQCIVNLSALQLNAVGIQINQLKKLLASYWNTDSLPQQETQHAIGLVIEVVQCTHRLQLSGPLPNGKYSALCQLDQTFANQTTAKVAIDSITKQLREYNRLSMQPLIIEHCLLRPSPEEFLYQITFLNQEGEAWAKSTQNYQLSSLSLLSTENSSILTWSVITKTTEHHWQTSCLPPYNTSKSTAKTSSLIEFTITNDKEHSNFEVSITINSKSASPKLTSLTGFPSEEDACTVINTWIGTLVSTSPERQNSWKINSQPYKLTNLNYPVDLPKYVEVDPYSSIITVILPNWPIEFQETSYQQHLEQIIERETPAHLLVNILWVDHQWHQEFSKLYKTWKELYSSAETEQKHLSYLGRPMMDMILQLSYPREQY